MNFFNWWPNTSPDESAPLDSSTVEQAIERYVNDPAEDTHPTNIKTIESLVERYPAEPPKDPEPDLSTKPNDVVGYYFGYACPEKHVFGFFDSITLEGYKVRKPCQTCGGIGVPAVVRRIAEAKWADTAQSMPFTPPPEPRWDWYNAYSRGFGKTRTSWGGNPCWTTSEFVHYLDSPKPRRTRKRVGEG